MDNVINEGMNLKISKEELKRYENISKKLNLKSINAEKKKKICMKHIIYLKIFLY